MAEEHSQPDGYPIDGATEVEPASVETPPPRKRGCLRVGCLIVLGGFLCIVLAGRLFSLLEPPWRLATGWWSFLARWHEAGGAILWNDVALAGCLLLILGVGGHSFARWIARSRDFDGWRGGTTAKSVAGLLTASVAGIALLGIAHQVFWIATSKSRMTESVWRDMIQRSETRSRLREVSTGLEAYLEAHGEFPVGGMFRDDGTPMHSWATKLLPFLSDETEALAAGIDLHSPWNSDANREAMQQHVRQLNVKRKGADKTEDGYATSRFAANSHLLRSNQAFRIADVSDGLSETVFLGDVRFRHKAWGDPTNTRDLTLGINQRADGFGSEFIGVATFLMGDGSVRFLSERTDPAVLKALATPNGGESAGDF